MRPNIILDLVIINSFGVKIALKYASICFKCILLPNLDSLFPTKLTTLQKALEEIFPSLLNLKGTYYTFQMTPCSSLVQLFCLLSRTDQPWVCLDLDTVVEKRSWKFGKETTSLVKLKLFAQGKPVFAHFKIYLH